MIRQTTLSMLCFGALMFAPALQAQDQVESRAFLCVFPEDQQPVPASEFVTGSMARVFVLRSADSTLSAKSSFPEVDGSKVVIRSGDIDGSVRGTNLFSGTVEIGTVQFPESGWSMTVSERSLSDYTATLHIPEDGVSATGVCAIAFRATAERMFARFEPNGASQ